MALQFDGTNDQVDHGDVVNCEGAALSASFWLWQIVHENNAGILAKGDATTGFRFSQVGATDQLIFQTMAGSTYGQTAVGDFPIGSWIHVGFVYDGAAGTDAGKVKIYKNAISLTLTYPGGSPDASITGNAVGLTSGMDAVVGLFSNIKMAHMRMWNAVLTADEIANEMHRFVPFRTTNLLVWSPYNDGTLARDYSGNGYHGTVTEATQVDGPTVVAYDSRAKLARAERGGYGDRNRFRRLGGIVPLHMDGI